MTLRYIITDGETCRFTYIPNEEVRVKIPKEYKATSHNGEIGVLAAALYTHLYESLEKYTRPLRGMFFPTPDGWAVTLYDNAQMVERNEYTICAIYVRGKGVQFEEGQ